MFNNIKADIDRYAYMTRCPWFVVVLTQQGAWASIQYRFNRWVHTRVRITIIRQMLKLFGYFWYKLVQITTGIDLPETAEIGKGLYIGHFGTIIVGVGVKLGENCNLSQDITVGYAGLGEKRGCPTIGDRVYIAPGARVIGKINIGNDVVIGANAVVTKDLPDRAIAVGVPAKIINYNSSESYVIYRGKPTTTSSSIANDTPSPCVEEDGVC